MSYPLQLTYNGVALHDLGDVSIVSQSGTFSPEEFPQVETRTISVQILTWAQSTGYNYDTLHASIKSLRDALQSQNKILKWQSPGDTAQGQIQLQRPVMVASHDIPEDANSWGIYNQQINVSFRFEVDTSADSTTLTATVTAGGVAGVNYSPIPLGKVHKWKDEYRNNFYSDWKDIRQRSSGMVTCSGEIRQDTGETGVTTDGRLASVFSTLTALKTQLEAGRYITLVYGPVGARLFDRAVKIESFTADIDQGPMVGVIKWHMTCSYTLFPNEPASAGCDFTTALSQDRENGRDTLSLTGTVTAQTEALAVSKLTTVESTMRTAYGFTAAQQLRYDVTKRWVSAKDTEALSSTNSGASVAKTQFIELTFSCSWEKKTADITTYNLTISDVDDLESGLITRTYAGSVTATSSTEEAAYTAALTLARSLGDKKYSFRVSKSETRADRKTAVGNKEFLRVDFSYSYRLKGDRMFLSMSSSVSNDTFGETVRRVTGFVVASSLTTANTYYRNVVRSLYTNSHIRNETLDERSDYVQIGSAWTASPGSGNEVMGLRLDFSLAIYEPKAEDTYAIKYAVDVVPDYVALTQTTTVMGVIVGDEDYLKQTESGETNPLATFIDNLVTLYGAVRKKQLSYEKELINSSELDDAKMLSVRFGLEFEKALPPEAQILKCQMREDITYSGTRWRVADNPSSTTPSTIQNCGKTVGERSVTANITAATEYAAMVWAQRQHGSTGIWGTWRTGITAPATRYEQPMRIGISYEFAPLVDGVARGTGSNVQLVNMDLAFTELIPDLPAPF